MVLNNVTKFHIFLIQNIQDIVGTSFKNDEFSQTKGHNY